jgi:acyl-CoA synthetase (AMP-forming)/AMP-acid ligase II
VRGTNHYPQELEYSAQDACPEIRPGCCAAFSFEEGGEERVAIVAELERKGGAAPDAEKVAARVRQAIAEEHGLRVHRIEFVRPGTIPKTTSGKIQRQLCRKLMQTGRLEHAA